MKEEVGGRGTAQMVKGKHTDVLLTWTVWTNSFISCYIKAFPERRFYLFSLSYFKVSTQWVFLLPFFFFSQISFRISFSKRECQISRTKALVLMPTVPGWIVCILIYVESSVPKVLKARHFRCVTLRCPLWSLLWKFSECLFNWKSTFLGPSFERKKWKCTVVNRNISAQGEICLSHCDAKIAANSFLLFLLRDSRCSNLCKLIN